MLFWAGGLQLEGLEFGDDDVSLMPPEITGGTRMSHCSSALNCLVEIGYTSHAQKPIRLFVPDLNVVHRQFRRTADDASFRQNMTVGSGSKMAPVDFDANRRAASEINIPASVQTGGSFCEHHADAAVQEAVGLAHAI